MVLYSTNHRTNFKAIALKQENHRVAEYRVLYCQISQNHLKLDIEADCCCHRCWLVVRRLPHKNCRIYKYKQDNLPGNYGIIFNFVIISDSLWHRENKIKAKQRRHHHGQVWLPSLRSSDGGTDGDLQLWLESRATNLLPPRSPAALRTPPCLCRNYVA